MATVNKDFKIKSGLVVEGTNGTINGFDILTESQDSIDFIVGVIGGETLITSVESTQLEVVAGELSVKSGVFDAAGAADAAELAANGYTDGEITTALTTAQGYADNAEADANSYTDQEVSAEVTNRNNAIDQAINTEVTDRNSAIATAKGEANAYTDGEITTALTTAQGYADTAEADANDYTDSAISTEVTNRNSAIATAKGEANDYTDTAVANLVDGAPALLDTLNELAAALQDNPDIIADLQDVAAGKQDTLTAGSNIDITGATISVTGLDTDDVSEGTNLYFTDARALTATASAYDAAGSALAAQDNAEGYTDNAISTEVTNRNSAISDAIATEVTDRNTAITTAVDAIDTDVVEEGEANLYFTDNRAKTSAMDLLVAADKTNVTIEYNVAATGLVITAENGVADSTTDDLVEGENNLYFTDERAIDAVSNADIYPNAVIIDNVAKQVASQITAATAGIQVGHAFDKTSYRSAEFLVKVAYGTHTEISKVLLTLDTSDNIAITEYGIVGTNGSASSISAGISGTDVQLLVTTTNNNSTVTVIGTLLI